MIPRRIEEHSLYPRAGSHPSWDLMDIHAVVRVKKGNKK
jgi:hypothetical protein